MFYNKIIKFIYLKSVSWLYWFFLKESSNVVTHYYWLQSYDLVWSIIFVFFFACFIKQVLLLNFAEFACWRSFPGHERWQFLCLTHLIIEWCFILNADIKGFRCVFYLDIRLLRLIYCLVYDSRLFWVKLCFVFHCATAFSCDTRTIIFTLWADMFRLLSISLAHLFN